MPQYTDISKCNRSAKVKSKELLKVVDGSDIDLVQAKYRIVVLTVRQNGIYKFINAVFCFIPSWHPSHALLEEF
jgi:hypothetical protein